MVLQPSRNGIGEVDEEQIGAQGGEAGSYGGGGMENDGKGVASGGERVDVMSAAVEGEEGEVGIKDVLLGLVRRFYGDEDEVRAAYGDEYGDEYEVKIKAFLERLDEQDTFEGKEELLAHLREEVIEPFLKSDKQTLVLALDGIFASGKTYLSKFVLKMLGEKTFDGKKFVPKYPGVDVVEAAADSFIGTERKTEERELLTTSSHYHDKSFYRWDKLIDALTQWILTPRGGTVSLSQLYYVNDDNDKKAVHLSGKFVGAKKDEFKNDKRIIVLSGYRVSDAMKMLEEGGAPEEANYEVYKVMCLIDPLHAILASMQRYVDRGDSVEPRSKLTFRLKEAYLMMRRVVELTAKVDGVLYDVDRLREFEDELLPRFAEAGMGNSWERADEDFTEFLKGKKHIGEHGEHGVANAHHVAMLWKVRKELEAALNAGVTSCSDSLPQ